MVLEMVSSTKPAHGQRLGVVVMVGVYAGCSALLAGLTDKRAIRDSCLNHVVGDVNMRRSNRPPSRRSLRQRHADTHGVRIFFCLGGPLTVAGAEFATPALHFVCSGKESLSASPADAFNSGSLFSHIPAADPSPCGELELVPMCGLEPQPHGLTTRRSIGRR